MDKGTRANFCYMEGNHTFILSNRKIKLKHSEYLRKIKINYYPRLYCIFHPDCRLQRISLSICLCRTLSFSLHLCHHLSLFPILPLGLTEEIMEAERVTWHLIRRLNRWCSRMANQSVNKYSVAILLVTPPSHTHTHTYTHTFIFYNQ